MIKIRVWKEVYWKRSSLRYRTARTSQRHAHLPRAIKSNPT